MANHSGIIDSGTYFEIVPNTRKIMVPSAYKVIGAVGDHLSEQVTIRCPIQIDGHNVADCARHYVTWKNVIGTVGHDEMTIVDSDNEYIYFTWVVRDALALAKGLVSFSIHFEDVDASGRIIYRWGTTNCEECEILDSVNAVLGAYEAIYVAGETLVIADYNPVKDGTLSLESNGIIPDGTLKIDKNGIHDVGMYAQAEVAVVEDANLKPENIKDGVNILGIEGNYRQCDTVKLIISNNIGENDFDTNLNVYVSQLISEKVNGDERIIRLGEEVGIDVIRGTLLIVSFVGDFDDANVVLSPTSREPMLSICENKGGIAPMNYLLFDTGLFDIEGMNFITLTRGQG